ncbi:MAG: hybrid sensor histidine kinase/response regulator [Magnetococcales bacterium]|nr:hybrid sensor histidine kinase/response regulator [Magnetococcales bacterium]MBF0150191.1 hybrid sensor histidine kinase/response regulator [Magnetococcales bacterium]MBF0173447.1 hybrid sensor histidine kinase/response regulator [Magnetococcales bacterium]MBF0347923.1 hybrid sensor histidine kinase/response regulator [Magnetococcales bacterium]MBF0631917.1 hybrid sensor histidine kinase/response regulator [Magnetococcales bacterium]
METQPRLLIVDDQPDNIRILMHAMGHEYLMISAHNGAAALEIARTEPQPDIILLDVMMPGMDGFEVCRRLKADRETVRIPVIFLTSLTDPVHEVEGLELGAADYLAKPFNLPVVRARVKTHYEIVKNRRQLEVQNRQLLESQKLRDELESITRHDLKSPLAVILGFIQLMLHEKMNPSVIFLEQMEKAGLQMLEMINGSLDLYRIEQGVYAYHPSNIVVSRLVERVVGERHIPAQKRQVRVILVGVREDHDSSQIMAEELLGYSMFANLLDNALEATPVGGEVIIGLRREGDWVIISLSNPGTVPEAIRDRFFDKFVTFGKRQGSGIGTYSARLIARLFGGDITMETDEIKGTVLTIRLPVLVRHAGTND